jgi:hypothetical protein
MRPVEGSWVAKTLVISLLLNTLVPMGHLAVGGQDDELPVGACDPRSPDQSLYSVKITCDSCDGSVRTNTMEGSSHSYEATVTNDGLRADAYRVVALNDKEWEEAIIPDTLSLLPGQSGKVNVTIKVPGNVPDRTRSVTNVIVQSTSTGCSNCANVDVTTTVQSPSLIVDDIKVDPENPKKGEEARIIVTVRNEGSMEAKEASVKIDIDGETFEGEQDVGGIPVAGSKTIEVKWTPDGGDHEIKATISSAYRSVNDKASPVVVDSGGDLASGPMLPVLVFVALLVIASFVITYYARKRDARSSRERKGRVTKAPVKEEK